MGNGRYFCEISSGTCERRIKCVGMTVTGLRYTLGHGTVVILDCTI
jgi:hypothetical protein